MVVTSREVRAKRPFAPRIRWATVGRYFYSRASWTKWQRDLVCGLLAKFFSKQFRSSQDSPNLQNVPRSAKSAQARTARNGASRVTCAPESADIAPSKSAIGPVSTETAVDGASSGRKWRKSKDAAELETLLWKQWPTRADWPGFLWVDEAAAFLRVSPCYIRDVTELDRDGKSLLPHQRLPGTVNRQMRRIRKEDLEAFGFVPASASSPCAKRSPCASCKHASSSLARCGDVAAK